MVQSPLLLEWKFYLKFNHPICPCEFVVSNVYSIMWIDQDQPCENKSYYKMHRITNFGTHPLAKLKSLVRLNTHAKGEKIKSKTQLASTHDWRVHILICWVDLQICKSSNQFIANGTSFDVLQFISDSCIAA